MAPLHAVNILQRPGRVVHPSFEPTLDRLVLKPPPANERLNNHSSRTGHRQSKRRRILAPQRIVKTLLIDNFDSYTYNLYQLLAEVNGGDFLLGEFPIVNPQLGAAPSPEL